MHLIVTTYRQEDLPIVDELISLRRHKTVSQGTLEEIAQTTGVKCTRCEKKIDCSRFPVHRTKWLACTVQGDEENNQLFNFFMDRGIMSLEACESLDDFCRSKHVRCYDCNVRTPQCTLPAFLQINETEATTASSNATQERNGGGRAEVERTVTTASCNGTEQTAMASTSTPTDNQFNFSRIKQEPVDEYTNHTEPTSVEQPCTSANGCQQEAGSRLNGVHQNGNSSESVAAANFAVEEKPPRIAMPSENSHNDRDQNMSRGVNLAHKDVLKGYIMARTLDLVPEHFLKPPRVKQERIDNEHEYSNNGPETPQQNGDLPSQAATSSSECHTPASARDGVNVSLRSLLVQQAKVAPLPMNEDPTANIAPEESTSSQPQTTNAEKETRHNENETTAVAAPLKRPRPVPPPFPRRNIPADPATSDTASTTSSAPSQRSMPNVHSLNHFSFSSVDWTLGRKGFYVIVCRICKKELRVKNDSQTDERMKRMVAGHVLRHMKTQAYSCNLCEFSSNFKRSISKHMEKEHFSQNDYKDRVSTSEFSEEALAKLNHCFIVQH